MTQSVYLKLRGHLNTLPIGMPETDSHIEVDVLRELFSADEAEMALHLTPLPESIEEIAHRLGREADEIAPVISRMVEKGLIFWTGEGETRKYNLMSFYPGILELQYKRLGENTAKKISQYLNMALTKELVGTKETRIFRVIPIEQKVSADLYVFPYDKVASIIDSADQVCLTECFCRKHKETAGESCGRRTDTCLIFGDYGKMFVERGLGEVISKQRAMEVLDRCEKEGLIHCTFNTAVENLVICNCCGCCCSILRGATRLNIPAAVVKSDYRIEIDAGRCIGCGTCVDRCHFTAISLQNEKASVDQARCVGCGVCIVTCPAEARRLVRKAPEERTTPFDNPETVMAKLSEERRANPSGKT